MKKNIVDALKYLVYFLAISSICWACEGDSVNDVTVVETPVDVTPQTVGSGFFNYEVLIDSNPIIMKVFYHVPENVTTQSKVLFIFHGNDRNANDYRNAMISKSEQYNFIAITPEFSISNFPSGDQYNLGNVFTDGDNPSPSTLNDEANWTFSIIEPLFNEVKTKLNNESQTYSIFGHSAGAQFAHRLLSFKPQSRFDKIVASAAGWYTLPDNDISFPYGYGNSPLENYPLPHLFAQNMTVLVGSNDNDRNAAGLRHNPVVDMQGLNRFARAQNYFEQGLQLSNQLNTTFNWQLEVNTGADHDYVVASLYAADLLFND
jgi:pimeloyl-ACP methyl ester carboxylesterase